MAEDVVTDQASFAASVESALASGQPDTITARGGSAFVSGSNWVLPGDAAAVSITFDTSPFQIGNGDGDAALTLQSGALLTVNTTSGTSAGRIEIGNGGTGQLTISGGAVQVNLADTSTTPGTSIGRIWVGGGATNTAGGTGTLTITGGQLRYAANAGSLNYGGLAIGRGSGVTGTLNQSGGTVQFSSAGALDLGTHGGNGTYALSGDAVFDASAGGMTAFIGSRTAVSDGSGAPATGMLKVSDSARFTMTTGSFAGGKLLVGDSKGTGTITQDGANTSVTLSLANPIAFGSDASNSGTGGNGTYNLSAGTLTVGNVDGGSQMVFGAASGGTGTFNISGGSAEIAAPLVLASVAGATGTLNLTGGALTLSGSSYLRFGAGTGTVNLDGGTLIVGGTDGIRGTGAFNFGGGTLKVGSTLATSNAMTLTAGKTATIDTNGNSATLSGVLSGSGALSKSGAGALILTGTNTYSGGTTISAGTLQIGAGGTTGVIVGNITNNSALVFNRSDSLTYTNIISGTGSVTQAGTGYLSLYGANTFSGGLIVSGGSLSVQTDGNMGDSAGTVTLSGGGILSVATFLISNRTFHLGTGGGTINTIAGSSVTLTGTVDGSGGLTKAGASTLTLSGTASYTGATTVSAGTLQINTASFSLDIVNNATVAFGSDLTYAGTISGTGALTKNTGGTLILSGTNTYSGLTTITAGTLQIAEDAALGNGGGLRLNGGTLATTATFSSSRPVTMAAASTVSVATGTTLTLSGAITGSGRLTADGAGTLILSGANTYSGGTTISAGTVQISASSGLGTGSGTVILSGGTLVATATSGTLRVTTLSGAGGTFAPAANTTLTWNGKISGTALSMAGAGTLVLAGSNDYSGGTTIASGIVSITLDANLGTGSLTMAGGTLTSTSSSITMSRAVSLAANATFAPQSSRTLTISGAITGSGRLTMGGAGTLALSGENTYSGGTIVSSGTLQIGALGTTGSITGDITNNGTIVFARSNTITFGGIISGTGAVTKRGTGTVTLTGTNTYGGGTSISVGTLQVSADANLGDATGGIRVSNSGILVTTDSFSSSRAMVLIGGTISPATGTTLTLSGPISGSGLLKKGGAGTLIVSGANTYTGGTSVLAGTLDVTGSLVGAADVATGTTLKGSGSITGVVTVQTGATLAGAQGSGLTMGGLVLSSGSILDVTLRASSAGRVLIVNGDLTLDGTLNVTKETGFGAGVYTVIDYTGTLTDNGLDLTALGSGLRGMVQTAQAGKVNLVVEGVDNTLQFWNGSTTTAMQAIQGGTGTWTAGPDTNWTTPSGAFPQASNAAFAIFQGTAGTVNIDTGAGAVAATGLQFVTSGYVVRGGALTLTGTAPATIRVGDGTQAGAATVATIESVIAGTSGLKKTDYGTLLLAGQNTYSGGTTIAGGKLQISADSNLGDAAAGLSFDGGTLAVTSSFASARAITLTGTGTMAPAALHTLTLSGTIAGQGGLVLSGDGTLALIGTNTYSGGTTISSGTLQVGADSAIGAAGGGLAIATGTLATTATFTSNRAVGLTGNATIETADATTLTLAGVISGSGSLTKAGSGTLILTGNNSFTGTTTIAAGTLQIGDGGAAGAITGNIVNNGSLVLNRSDSYTIAGAITGNGSLTLSGGGKATFGASVSGQVTVADTKAVLAAGSTTTADFVVGNGGVLGGTAAIAGLIVNGGGTAAPGYSPGTLTVNGPVTFNNGSVYAVDVTPDGSHDRIIASGNVTLSSGARVDVVASAGVYSPSSQLTILTTSGTLTGTFGKVTSNFAFLTPTLRYDAKNVYLDLVYSGKNIVDYAQTRNQAGGATAMQALGKGNSIFDAITVLSETAVAPALDQLSGEIYPSINAVIGQQGVYLRDTIGTRLRQTGAGPLGFAAKSAGLQTAALGHDRSSVVWAQGFGAWGQTLGNGNAATITSGVGGVIAGVDVAVTETLRAGLVTGYSGTRLNVDGRASSGTMGSVDLGAYVGAQFGALALRGGASYGWHNIAVQRSIVFPGFADQQSASYRVGTLQVFGEASYRMAFAGYEVEPFASLAYVNQSGGSAQESGLGAAGLSINVAGQQTLYTTLGTRFATTITLEDGATLTPSLSLGWQHAFGDTATKATMQSGSTSFTTEGAPVAKDMLNLGAGLSYAISDALSLEVNYAGKFAEGASQSAFSLKLSGRF